MSVKRHRVPLLHLATRWAGCATNVCSHRLRCPLVSACSHNRLIAQQDCFWSQSMERKHQGILHMVVKDIINFSPLVGRMIMSSMKPQSPWQADKFSSCAPQAHAHQDLVIAQQKLRTPTWSLSPPQWTRSLAQLSCNGTQSVECCRVPSSHLASCWANRASSARSSTHQHTLKAAFKIMPQPTIFYVAQL